MIMAFLVVFNKDGMAKVNLIQSKTFLAANISTIPQREFHGLALAAQFCRQLVSELAHLLQNFIVCTDAKICVYWCLSNCRTPKTIFVENRTQMIKSSLETSIDLLMESQAERGDTENLKTRGDLQKQNYKDVLFWIPSGLNKSDCGSKYLTFNETNQNYKMLTPDDIDPALENGEAVAWMTDIEGHVKKQTILSARDIENQKKDMEEDPHFKTGFKQTSASKLKKETSILLRDNEGKTQIYRVDTGNENRDNEILALKDPENSTNRAKCTKASIKAASVLTNESSEGDLTDHPSVGPSSGPSGDLTDHPSVGSSSEGDLTDHPSVAPSSKGDLADQPSVGPPPEQSEDDLVGVLGYKWHPKKDFIKLKPPIISNGKKAGGN